MSDPSTDIQTQKARHKTPLTAIVVIVVAVALLFFAYLSVIAERGEPLSGSEATEETEIGPDAANTDN